MTPPKMTADEYCAILRQWAEFPYVKALLGDAAERVRLAMYKSNYLARRLYGGEDHRTIPCPQHKGHWSGLPALGRDCAHGCGLTGWLPGGPFKALEDAPWAKHEKGDGK